MVMRWFTILVIALTVRLGPGNGTPHHFTVVPGGLGTVDPAQRTRGDGCGRFVQQPNAVVCVSYAHQEQQKRRPRYHLQHQEISSYFPFFLGAYL
jgi:hypothetical protein